MEIESWMGLSDRQAIGARTAAGSRDEGGLCLVASCTQPHIQAHNLRSHHLRAQLHAITRCTKPLAKRRQIQEGSVFCTLRIFSVRNRS